MKDLNPVLNLLGEVAEDRTVPRNIRSAVNEAKSYLEDKTKDMDLKISSAISILDEVINDPNIPMYTRTQIWNIVTILESLKAQK
ncbi:MAG: UPF0147 family protein [Candidatus Aenigmatarchaeota archaeon]